MKEKQTQMWVPMYVDKWLFGSTRLELEPGERSVFVDLIMLGAKDDGYIRANETIPYPPRQLAAFLNVSEELLLSTISKCLQYAKLEEVSPGMWRVYNWENFQLSKSYKSELENGKKDIPGHQRTESSQQRTKSSPIREDSRVEDKKIDDIRGVIVSSSVTKLSEAELDKAIQGPPKRILCPMWINKKCHKTTTLCQVNAKSIDGDCVLVNP